MEQKWYQKSNFRNLVDMHITNAEDGLLRDFDPEVYAENMETAGFDSVYLYASNCQGLCLYPSKVGFLHQEAKKRDLFGETVKACRKRGIRTLGYLNHWSTAASDAHPDWKTMEKDGTGHRDREGHNGRYGVCCFNSPYRDLMLGMVREVCGNYPIDGLWIDMLTYARDVCYCENCRRLHREETGREIPDTVDWTSPEWRRYVRFRERSLLRYVEDIKKAANEVRPGITVSANAAEWHRTTNSGQSSAYYHAFDYTAGDFYSDVKGQTIDCKFLRGISKNQPFEYMVSRCPELAYHTGSKPLWQLRQQAYSSFLHGGAFLLIDAIDPAGTMNRDVYETFGKIRRELEPYWNLPSFLKGEYRNDLAVYFNFESAVDLFYDGEKADTVRTHDSALIKRLKNINEVLSSRHIQYDLITEQNLADLTKYPAILLSEVSTLSKTEVKALTEYVRDGGRLYVSGKTGILNNVDDTEGNGSLVRSDFALSEVMGVSLVGEDFPYDSCYIQGVPSSGLFSEGEDRYPIGTKAAAPKVRVHEDTRILATATLPYSDHSDPRRYLTAIGDPPYRRTDDPIMTEHPFGDGLCIYCSLLMEDDPVQPSVGEVFLRILDRLLGDTRQIIIDAPSCMEASVKSVDGDLCISLLNTLWHETESPARETSIYVKNTLIDGKSVTVFPSGHVETELKEDGIRIKASSLPEFSVLTVKA